MTYTRQCPRSSHHSSVASLLGKQERNEGRQGEHNFPGANSLWGRRITAGAAEKSQQSHKHFLQYSKFAFERAQVRTRGQNRRQKVFSRRALRFCRGDMGLCEGAWHSKIDKISTVESCFMIQFGGLGALFGGGEAPRGNGTAWWRETSFLPRAPSNLVTPLLGGAKYLNFKRTTVFGLGHPPSKHKTISQGRIFFEWHSSLDSSGYAYSWTDQCTTELAY